MGKKLILSVAIAAGLAYMLYVPFPDECDFPWRIKATFIAFEAMKLAGEVNVMFGGSFATPFKLSDLREPKNITGIEITRDSFAGVEVAIYRPEGFAKNGPGAAMIYFHGGGWTIGSVASYSPQTISFAKKTGMLVVVPEYRLAPEHPFPAAFDDCLKVTDELLKRANEFDVNPKKIALAGDSAGGNLATAVSLKVGGRDSSIPNPICMNNLIYPGLQLANFRQTSYLQNPDGPLLSPSLVARFLLNYIGLGDQTELIPLLTSNAHMNGFKDKDGFLNRMSGKWVPEKYKKRPFSGKEKLVLSVEDVKPLLVHGTRIQELATNPDIAPLAAPDELLRVLPKTNIVTCEYDVLRDDGIILLERMKSLGLKVSHENWDFCAHGLLASYGLVEYDKLDKAVERMLNVIVEEMAKC